VPDEPYNATNARIIRRTGTGAVLEPLDVDDGEDEEDDDFPVDGDTGADTGTALTVTRNRGSLACLSLVVAVDGVVVAVVFTGDVEDVVAVLVFVGGVLVVVALIIDDIRATINGDDGCATDAAAKSSADNDALRAKARKCMGCWACCVPDCIGAWGGGAILINGEGSGLLEVDDNMAAGDGDGARKPDHDSANARLRRRFSLRRARHCSIRDAPAPVPSVALLLL
jgi:hypothetical protein